MCRRSVAGEFEPKSNYVSIMCWGGMTDLFIKPSKIYVTSSIYCDLILQPNLKYLKENCLKLIQEDAPSHTAKFTIKYFNDSGIEFRTCFPRSPDMNPMNNYIEFRTCSARSPDMNPIKTVWDLMIRRVALKIP